MPWERLSHMEQRNFNSKAHHLSTGTLGSDEFPRGRSDFGSEQLNRRLIVCSKEEAGDAVSERDFRQILGPLLWWSIEQRTSRSRKLPGNVEQPADAGWITSRGSRALVNVRIHCFQIGYSPLQIGECGQPPISHFGTELGIARPARRQPDRDA